MNNSDALKKIREGLSQTEVLKPVEPSAKLNNEEMAKILKQLNKSIIKVAGK